jgi:hypothetical protein
VENVNTAPGSQADVDKPETPESPPVPGRGGARREGQGGGRAGMRRRGGYAGRRWRALEHIQSDWKRHGVNRILAREDGEEALPFPVTMKPL